MAFTLIFTNFVLTAACVFITGEYWTYLQQIRARVSLDVHLASDTRTTFSRTLRRGQRTILSLAPLPPKHHT